MRSRPRGRSREASCCCTTPRAAGCTCRGCARSRRPCARWPYTTATDSTLSLVELLDASFTAGIGSTQELVVDDTDRTDDGCRVLHPNATLGDGDALSLYFVATMGSTAATPSFVAGPAAVALAPTAADAEPLAP